MRKKMIVIMSAMVILILIACTTEVNDSLIGIWERDFSDAPQRDNRPREFYIFNEDGTGEMRIVRGEQWNFYSISEFYWELSGDVIVTTLIRWIEFSGMENRDNPPTIFFDRDTFDGEIESHEIDFEIANGVLIFPIIGKSESARYLRIDAEHLNNSNE